MTPVEQSQLHQAKELELRIEKEKMLLSLWRNGFTQKQIASMLDITESRVYQIIRKAKIREQKD